MSHFNPMKASTAISICLRRGIYEDYTQLKNARFMCRALEYAQAQMAITMEGCDEAISTITDKMVEITGGRYSRELVKKGTMRWAVDTYYLRRNRTDLLSARAEATPEENFQWMQQLYCWFVFDLKRKGL